VCKEDTHVTIECAASETPISETHIRHNVFAVTDNEKRIYPWQVDTCDWHAVISSSFGVSKRFSSCCTSRCVNFTGIQWTLGIIKTRIYHGACALWWQKVLWTVIDLHTHKDSGMAETAGILTFWRRNYFFLILAHLAHKMWIIHEPNMLELWNKLHFE